MVTSSLHVLVWEEDGEELLILTSVQDIIVLVSGGRPHNLVLASVEWPVLMESINVLAIVILFLFSSTQSVCTPSDAKMIV